MSAMASNAMFARVAGLAGDPARAGMLHALMDGRALTASELARVAAFGRGSRCGIVRAQLHPGLDTPHQWYARSRNHAQRMARISGRVRRATGGVYRRVREVRSRGSS